MNTNIAKHSLLIMFTGLAITFSSCEKILMEPNPDTSNIAIFNEYATLVKEKHAMLDYKGVDIQHLKDSLGATINDNTTEVELFAKLATITYRLRDGHSDLSSNVYAAHYNFIAAFPPGFHHQILSDNYTGTNVNPGISTIGDKLVYGFLPQDDEIAYIWIPSWDIEMEDSEIEQVFSAINSAKGLVFDMRQNTGGDPALATKFASYLTSAVVYTGFERFKTGPGPGEFSDSEVFLQPSGSSNKFLKPVAVLTDRFCYSASTTFAYSVNPLDNVTFIGQRTGGGSGSVADGYLANGWKWSLSTSEFIDHLGNHLDDGIDPDISVALDTLVTTQDEVIEAAIDLLQ